MRYAGNGHSLFLLLYDHSACFIIDELPCQADLTAGHVKHMANIKRMCSTCIIHGHWSVNYAVVNISILHAKEFLLYFTWPLPVTVLGVWEVQ